MAEYLMALDQGTTSSRAIIFDRKGDIVSVAQKEFTQYFPANGMVEQDPLEIWASEVAVMSEVKAMSQISGDNIAAIGTRESRCTGLLCGSAEGQPTG